MPLTDTFVRTVKPIDKDKKYSDSEGLFLLVTKAGGKSWRLKFRINGKEDLLVIGRYPDVTLADARDARREAKKLIAQGINPKQVKSDHKQAIEAARLADEEKALAQVYTFQKLFYEWFDAMQKGWQSTQHADKVEQRIKNHVFPFIAEKPVIEINKADCFNILGKLDKENKTHMRDRIKGLMRRVFDYAYAHDKIEKNPCDAVIEGMYSPHQTKHYSAPTDPRDVREVMRKLRSCNDQGSVCQCLQLAPLIFLRPNEVAGILWDEVDFEQKIIRKRSENMKMKTEHFIPLSSQALAILVQQKQNRLSDIFVFPSPAKRGKPITPDSLRKRIRELGIDADKLTTHGFRHMASTALYELGESRDVIERQMAHVERDAVRRAYDASQFKDERTRVMQRYADWLDGLLTGND